MAARRLRTPSMQLRAGRGVHYLIRRLIRLSAGGRSSKVCISMEPQAQAVIFKKVPAVRIDDR
jgi:hypothetical protein